MHPNGAQYDDSRTAIEDLARIAASGERRLQRLERMFRWTAALFLLTLMLALYVLTQALSAGGAGAEVARSWPHVAPEVTAEDLQIRPEPEVVGPRAEFHQRIENLRARLADAEEEPSPFEVIAVTLHDIRGVLHDTRAALAAMPQMGEDMSHMRGDMDRIANVMGSMDDKMSGVPLMAEEMRRLNLSIDIMTTSIDSTMGRMGRIMPYYW
jgi:hypothetical protein